MKPLLVLVICAVLSLGLGLVVELAQTQSLRIWSPAPSAQIAPKGPKGKRLLLCQETRDMLYRALLERWTRVQLRDALEPLLLDVQKFLPLGLVLRRWGRLTAGETVFIAPTTTYMVLVPLSSRGPAWGILSRAGPWRPYKLACEDVTGLYEDAILIEFGVVRV